MEHLFEDTFIQHLLRSAGVDFLILSCVQWCQYARKCVGDEMYEAMMKIAAEQKSRK